MNDSNRSVLETLIPVGCGLLLGAISLSGCDLLMGKSGGGGGAGLDTGSSSTDSGAASDTASESDTGSDTGFPEMEDLDEPMEDDGYLYIDVAALLEVGFHDDGWLDYALTLVESEGLEFDMVAIVEPGCETGERCLQVFDPDHLGIFINEDAECSVDGCYTYKGFGSFDEFCTVFFSDILDDPLPEDFGDTPVCPPTSPMVGLRGGICGTLSVAHSLVDKLKVVNASWDDITATAADGTIVWHHDFLTLIAETGDQSGERNRSFTESEMDQAHEAAWNAGYTITKKFDEWQSIEQSRLTSCSDLKKWCWKLWQHNEKYQDDCLLALSGKYGHVMKINNVAYTEKSDRDPECRCTITVADTSKQDEGTDASGEKLRDFKNVRRSPGTQTWRIEAGHSLGSWYKNGKPTVLGTGGRSRAFNQAGYYTTSKYQCYDEDRVEGGRNEKGSVWP